MSRRPQRLIYPATGGAPTVVNALVTEGDTTIRGQVPVGSFAVALKKVGNAVTVLGQAVVNAQGGASYVLAAPAAANESYGFRATLEVNGTLSLVTPAGGGSDNTASDLDLGNPLSPGVSLIF